MAARSFHLSLLHASIARNLLNYSGLSVCVSTDRTPALEELRRLFWSLQLLDHFIGAPPQIPDLISSLVAPAYLATTTAPEERPIMCPLLPQDSFKYPDEGGVGIWAVLLQISGVWARVRNYLSECAEGRNQSPWAPNSTYSQINCMLLDTESNLALSYRYSASRFAERSLREVQSRQHYWLVWVHVQILYHSIQAILNHPFLYSQRASSHRRGPNVFWRTSAELAFLHGTWISRLVDMAEAKELEINDPFTADACAIAGTLHLFHSRASDTRIQARAVQGLSTCRSLIERLGSQCPSIQTLVCTRNTSRHGSSR